MSNVRTKFDIEKIVNYLKKYKNLLEKEYTWEVPTLPASLNITNFDRERLLSASNNFQQNIILKQILHSKLLHAKNTNFESFKELCIWIIKDWGGITAKSDQQLIENIYENIKAFSFDRIASRSKVLSFLDPENYIIYDSRVAYSINWILLTTKGKLFFPIPLGRNPRMTAFEMSVLIRLINSKNYSQSQHLNIVNRNYISNKDKELFLSKGIAYEKLNLLIKEISLKLWEDEERQKNLFYTEMLLFAIADTVVFDDIINRVQITLKEID